METNVLVLMLILILMPILVLMPMLRVDGRLGRHGVEAEVERAFRSRWAASRPTPSRFPNASVSPSGWGELMGRGVDGALVLVLGRRFDLEDLEQKGERERTACTRERSVLKDCGREPAFAAFAASGAFAG